MPLLLGPRLRTKALITSTCALLKPFQPHYYYSTTQQLPYEKIHIPVMLPQVLEHLDLQDGGLYCDMTFGDGGYTKAILDQCDCKVIAIDQDPTAYEKAIQLSQLDSYKNRLFPILGKFGSLYQSLQTKELAQLFKPSSSPSFDGIVMDIGVSSGQIETPSRGFSYKLDGPLDMRMFSRGSSNDPPHDASSSMAAAEHQLLKKSISCYELVNFFNQEQIANIIYQYGGDRLSRKIASAIVTARHQAPIATTGQLADIIQKACPQPRWQRGNDDMLRNSAARTFQAFRIYINDELGELESALKSCEYLLNERGRLVAVTFHSLEDRMVKNFMYHCAGKRSVQEGETNQFGLKRAANREYKKALKEESNYGGESLVSRKREVEKKKKVEPSFELCTKHVVQPTEEEVQENARSRSAKLRVARRTSNQPLEPFGPL